MGRRFTESDLIALAFALRSQGTPEHGLWQHLAATLQGQSGAEWPPIGRRESMMIVLEDGEAAITLMLKQRPKAMRHVLRMHRAAIECCSTSTAMPSIFLQHVSTRQQAQNNFSTGPSNKGA